jgi:hypothetical protein
MTIFLAIVIGILIIFNVIISLLGLGGTVLFEETALALMLIVNAIIGLIVVGIIIGSTLS